MELTDLKSIGKARLEALHHAGIDTLRDLLLCVPIGYHDTSTITPIGELQAGDTRCIVGYLKGEAHLARFHGLARVTCRVADETGTIAVTWFNQPWIKEQLDAQKPLMLCGRVDAKDGKLRMLSPTRETERGLQPVYRAIGGVPAKTLRACIVQALTQLEDCCPETLPASLRMRYGLCERNYAIRQAHFPMNAQALETAMRRLSFENMLFYQSALAEKRKAVVVGAKIVAPEGALDVFTHSLPYPLTGAQKRVLDEIAHDMEKENVMSRMVQGDVGSGKTAVAFGALYLAARAGWQGALMAPTEILARQHMESAMKTLEPLGVSCGLLLGGMTAAQKKKAREQIASGAWQVVIGTHALIQKDVNYQKLGLVVTDEQHRFGVTQRQRLSQKAELAPNTLVMSATPIPRTLALALYGDLDVSVLDEMPPGRTPVSTRIVPEEKRAGMYQFIIEEARKGRKTYIVCPLVEESEMLDCKSAQETYQELSKGALSCLRLGLTYGAQDAEEKAKTLENFAHGDLDVLVATTVIEVGVNVPEATCMVIENADRFGLSQLHQLRGRVGRGADKSWCFLLAEPNERLKTLCKTNDGFEVARRDLELRGAGELLGTRQHGENTMAAFAAGMDMQLLEETQHCMRELKTPEYAEEWAQVRAAAAETYQKMMDDIAMN